VNLNSSFSHPRRHTLNPRQLKRLTAAFTEQIGRYKRRSGAYDEDKQAIVSEGGGIRVWYDDYTTIGEINVIITFHFNN
jgi:hypothetical protein